MDQRTYSYGARPPTTNADLVREQLWLASRYRNDLTENSRAYHEQWSAICKPYWQARSDERKRLGAEVDATRAEHSDEPKPAISKLPPFRLSTEDEAKLKALTGARYAANKSKYNDTDAAWGTRLVVGEAVEAAVRAVCKQPFGKPPPFSRYDGSGALAVQLQGGLSVADLLDGNDTRARVIRDARARKERPDGVPLGPGRSGGRKQLWLRIGSDGRAPVWAVFPFSYHRDLPEHAVVKWVRVVARRVATKLKYSVQFVVEGQGLNPLLSPVKKTIAIDVGWRKRDNGVRVAAWCDSAGQHGELLMPEQLFARWEKAESLQGIRDRMFNDVVAEVRAHRETAPEWFREETQGSGAWPEWRAMNRLARLVWKWRKEHLPGDQAFCARLESWRAQDKHLYEWQANQRLSVLRARRDIYRCAAKWIAGYERVVFEKLDLRDFAELPGDGEEEPRAVRAARPRRFKVALSELFACVKDAVTRANGEWIAVDPAWTTQHCSACNKREEFDAVELHHHCSHCGETWDQDLNAAKNLLRAATCGEGVEDRSNAHTRANKEESKASKRRKKGLATRREGCSKEAQQP